uniref:Putative secreted protein n=1 Tax=Ixodes ricinus TaxID=34613 RepID=A0A6B0TSR5_IXORI
MPACSSLAASASACALALASLSLASSSRCFRRALSSVTVSGHSSSWSSAGPSRMNVRELPPNLTICPTLRRL